VRFFDLTATDPDENRIPNTGARKYLQAIPPKLIIGTLSSSQREWLTGIRLRQRRHWLRRHTSCETIFCPVEVEGRTNALLARIQGKAKTSLKITMDVSAMTKIKLPKCAPAWHWQVEIAEFLLADFIAQALNTADTDLVIESPV
jgi:hypothetical protein